MRYRGSLRLRRAGAAWCAGAAVLAAAWGTACFRVPFDRTPCGDGLCAADESCDGCPADCCPGIFCGNLFCDGAESCESCPDDCGVCPGCAGCGDGACAPGCGEECGSCPEDCGECPAKCAGCGDGSCDPAGCGEGCSNCPGDCGFCGEGYHQLFADGGGLAGLGGGQVQFFLVLTGGLDYITICSLPALPVVPGTGPAGSWELGLAGDDDSAAVSLSFTFPFPAFGVLWTELWVSANGYVTLGGPDFAAEPSVGVHYAVHRLAPLFADLAGGSVVVDDFVTGMAITWMGWSDAAGPAGTFQLYVNSSGDVAFGYESPPAVGAALVGISAGKGMGEAVDFLPAGGCP